MAMAPSATKMFGLRSALRLNPYILSRSPNIAATSTQASTAVTALSSAIQPTKTKLMSTGTSTTTIRAQSHRYFATTSSPSYSTPKLSASSSETSGDSMTPIPERAVISRETFQKLHKLSALNPPPPGSQEESDLMEGLSDLIHLMDRVKSVELPESVNERAGLLVEGIGIGEVLISDRDQDQDQAIISGSSSGGVHGLAGKDKNSIESTEKRGKELLGWATNRVGDFYASRIQTKS
ncbi:hypothetical protein I317_01754 [Kwoniella heveanensis CBS 569]|nr:hypothetical protein I317_01754 [Kwoniella heveanensis CBS 569]